jgi:glutathione S-transferase
VSADSKDKHTSEHNYLLIGSEESPYSVKVRSYLRYKKLPHKWLSRSEAPDLYQQHARLPLIPLLITPDGSGLQDSTPIIEAIESAHPEPSIHPEDEVCRFVSWLLEEFGDEWGNKWMFHYRWAREADQLACSKRLASIMSPEVNEHELSQTAATIRERMTNRVWFVGSSATTARQIEDSFKDTLTLLEAHFRTRPYLFGGRPSLADFALWGQLYNAHRDPTPRAIMRLQAPNTIDWIERMKDPLSESDFEPWPSLKRTLTPLLVDQVAGLFLPWSRANADAIAMDMASFSVKLRSGEWQQKPQKYHARSLLALRKRFSSSASSELSDLMQQTGCLEFLA